MLSKAILTCLLTVSTGMVSLPNACINPCVSGYPNCVPCNQQMQAPVSAPQPVPVPYTVPQSYPVPVEVAVPFRFPVPVQVPVPVPNYVAVPHYSTLPVSTPVLPQCQVGCTPPGCIPCPQPNPFGVGAEMNCGPNYPCAPNGNANQFPSLLRRRFAEYKRPFGKLPIPRGARALPLANNRAVYQNAPIGQCTTECGSPYNNCYPC